MRRNDRDWLNYTKKKKMSNRKVVKNGISKMFSMKK